MVRCTALNHPLGKYPAIVSAKSRTCRQDSNLHPGSPLQARMLRKPSFPRSRSGRKAVAFCTSGRRSIPGTSMLRWKFKDAGHCGKPHGEACGNSNRKTVNACRSAVEAVSARKLASGIWHLELREVTRNGGCGSEAIGGPVGFEHAHGELHPTHACNDNSRNLHFGLKNGFSCSVFVHKAASPMLLNHAMERATKWDAGCPRNSEDILGIFCQLKLLEGQHVSTASIISSLKKEVVWARTRIFELEAERQSAKIKLDSFWRKLTEEKASWCSKEHEKVRALIDIMKDDLSRAKKNRQWCENVNSKLRKELAEAKFSTKRLKQDYEKETKARELMEEVCHELAKEIEEVKDEVEALKRDSMKVQEEVAEERKMLQMAEIWREERVQMKLLDAKLALEDKYSKLSKLQTELITFLRAWTGSCSDKADFRRAQLLKEAVDLVRMEEIKEFAYQPPSASEDIFTVFEELQPKEEINEREIEACYAYSPASHDSNMHSLSPPTDAFLEKPTRRCCNKDTEDDSDWETLSPGEEQELQNSRGRSKPSVNEMSKEIEASVNEKDGAINVSNGKVNSESSELYSLAARQPGKKGASIARLWRLSCPNSGEIHSAELLNGNISNGKISNDDQSPECGLAEAVFSQNDQWTSPDSVNPHVAHRMKDCIRWPRGLQKHSLKAKLLEARMVERHKA